MSRERPILFNAEMVCAILDGRKTQTRRVMKPPPTADLSWVTEWGWTFFTPDKHISGRGRRPGNGPSEMFLPCPYALEQKLWVRETFTGDWRGNGIPARGIVNYRADGEIPEQYREGNYWRPSIFMPRWASRLTLEIVEVRVQRVRDITDDDAIEEGVDRTNTSIPTYATQRFQKLWDSINGKKSGCSWADNPFVWALTFKRV